MSPLGIYQTRKLVEDLANLANSACALLFDPTNVCLSVLPSCFLFSGDPTPSRTCMYTDCVRVPKNENRSVYPMRTYVH